MKVDRVIYQKIYPTGINYLNHRIGVEIELDETDNPDEAFKLAKETVERWNLESNPSYALAMEYQKGSEIKVNSEYAHLLSAEQLKQTPIQQPTKDERIQSFIATINMCTSLKFLQNFKARVEAEKNEELTTAFNNKLKSLE